MNRRTIGLTVVAVVILVGWIGTLTEWTDIEVPMPPKGEAATNPTYAAQRFLGELAMHATRDPLLSVPASNAVIVLSAWNWGLSAERAARIERWVESGGRLILDRTVAIDAEFTRWSGISREFGDFASKEAGDGKSEPCHGFQDRESTVHQLCDANGDSRLRTTRPMDWFLRDPSAGIQAARVRVGSGWVAVINADPFRFRRLFDGDHAWVLVSAGALRSGDEVHFLSEADHASLVRLIWQYGAPVVVSVLIVVGLWLWRGAVRFGPVAPPADSARRSLAEQIRGTGWFMVRQDGGDALHSAAVRALTDAARRRIAGYNALPADERTAIVAEVSGISVHSLLEAVSGAGLPRQEALTRAIAILETARRQVLRQGSYREKGLHGTA